MGEEVHVSTSNYSAQFGRVGGAVVNATTKSGTNSIHGSLWEFNRVAALAAEGGRGQAPGRRAIASGAGMSVVGACTRLTSRASV